jgi:hypothetical protein
VLPHCLSERCRPVALQRTGARDRARSELRKPTGVGEGLRLRVDVRRNDTERAHVEKPRRILEAVPCDARHRPNAERQRGCADNGGCVEADCAMLHVDEEGIEPARLRDHRDLGRACQTQCQAECTCRARVSGGPD